MKIMIIGASHAGYEATAINPTNHSVQFVNVVDVATESFNYDKLIIATGAHAFNLPIAGNDLDNVATLRHGKQHQLMATVKQANIKNIVVVGAGYIGMMVSDQLSQFGKKVTIVDINDRPLSTYLDADFTDILNNHMREKQIAFIPNTKVDSFSGNDHDQVTAVQTNHGVFDADLVVVSAGTRPNTDWIGGELTINERGYIVTDDYSKTSNKDIFAIGDSTEILYNPTHQRMNISLASNAERQARVAVRNLFEQTKPIHGVQ
ncbi:NAD(P)/FAD-dependent oxidoreductase [Paucilactobacillus nenjiangensis]|uniref:NAD(P)/FAD-dependent oxidoreductase n=1 Tax=Paucilactobacillus nenjiangensis TaxID=1296540 RepID=UPI003F9B1985